ncbi:DUF2799 domain-containing protein [Photobacterium sp. TY1-4]|uniref:DUF2799 domain-containing protein n=1 Tax=Photobacterium sp. TY1-4 TaxID=2899122 RepID=UPI0021C108D6|nr:DUF2799 domain-containing protein [Photobacterium sp. TY1-4]UXI01789.1 DUF2799 domain-containing protein [Photobacterium sp. TY1-4]
MLKYIFQISVVVLLLSGCSALTTQASLMADENWYQLGVSQGQRGEQPDEQAGLQSRAQTVNAALVVDYPAYRRGYQKGLASYCSLEQMRRLGLARRMDWGACEFRRQDGQLYQNFWQQGFDRSFPGADGW